MVRRVHSARRNLLGERRSPTRLRLASEALHQSGRLLVVAAKVYLKGVLELLQRDLPVLVAVCSLQHHLVGKLRG